MMHIESVDDGGDDDEPVGERSDDSDRDSSSTGLVGGVLWEVHSRDEVKHGGKSGC